MPEETDMQKKEREASRKLEEALESSKDDGGKEDRKGSDGQGED